MPTCNKPAAEFHHKDRNAAPTAKNGAHLCRDCHAETGTHGKERTRQQGEWKPFPENEKRDIERRSRGSCECVGCAKCQKLDPMGIFGQLGRKS